MVKKYRDRVEVSGKPKDGKIYRSIFSPVNLLSKMPVSGNDLSGYQYER